MPELLTEAAPAVETAPKASIENNVQETPQIAPPTPAAKPADDDLGLDRAFLISMAKIPAYAIGWAVGAVVLWKILSIFAPSAPTYLAPVIVTCIGMILAAVIDGWAFKVPNWLTLALVLSGWYLGIANSLGLVSGEFGGIKGGILEALAGTALGWALLFPALFIGGMGQGDVKMQMGFGSWIGATFGFTQNGGEGAMILLCSFAVGVLVGGLFGIVMMVMRRQLHKNLQNTREIFTDLQIMLTVGPKQAAERANSRRKDWVRLPYGVPLCVGLLGYLAYHFILSR
jgi:prepilin peptidase CpaA